MTQDDRAESGVQFQNPSAGSFLHNQVPLNSYYTATQNHQIQQFSSQLSPFVNRLSWNPEQIAAERQRKLRELLATAKNKSPWHANRLSHIDAETFTEREMDRLPTMAKRDLMRHFDKIVTDTRLSLGLIEQHLKQLKSDAYLLESFHAITSGGSSGERGVFVYDWNGWITVGLSAARVIPLMGIEAGTNETCAIIGGGNAAHGSPAFFQSFAPWFEDVFSEVLPLSVMQPMGEIVERLNKLQPTRVFGFPSFMYQLCFAAAAGKLKIAPKSILVGAEPLSAQVRSALERTFGANVYNFYGCSEGSCLGFSCSAGSGLHLSDDLMIIEPVDDAGVPVPNGVPSKRVLLTNLFNPLLPLIRYELEDSLTPMKSTVPCACGSYFRKIYDIHGRSDDSFHYTTGTLVHPIAFSILGEDPAIIEYQVRQTPRGVHILIHSTPNLELNSIYSDIQANLETLGIPEPEVSIELVDTINRNAGGKLRQFVRLC